jgi:hypothetical protein
MVSGKIPFRPFFTARKKVGWKNLALFSGGGQGFL